MKVLEVVVTDSIMQIRAVDPAKPTEVNEFVFRDGSVEPSRPVDISGSEPGALDPMSSRS